MAKSYPMLKGSSKRLMATKVKEMYNKIPNNTVLVSTGAFNSKPTGIENKTTNISTLATQTALNTNATDVESEIADITNLAIKVSLNTNATDIETKIPGSKRLITTPREFNRVAKTDFVPRIILEAKRRCSA